MEEDAAADMRKFQVVKKPFDDSNIIAHIRAGNEKEVAEFLENISSLGDSFNANSILSTGKTMMMEAVISKQTNIVTLLKAHSDTTATDSNCMTALHYAVIAGDLEIVEKVLSEYSLKIIDNDHCYTVLHLAAIHNEKGDIARDLIERGVDIYAQTNENYTCIHLAARYNRVEVLRTILSFDVFINSTDDSESALQIACRFGSLEAAELLIDAGADLNFKSKNGNTPLLEACSTASVEITKLLINSGADLFSSPSVLHVAVKNNQIEQIRYLLQFFSFDQMKTLLDDDGKNPIEIIRDDQSDIGDLLNNSSLFLSLPLPQVERKVGERRTRLEGRIKLMVAKIGELLATLDIPITNITIRSTLCDPTVLDDTFEQLLDADCTPERVKLAYFISLQILNMIVKPFVDAVDAFLAKSPVAEKPLGNLFFDFTNYSFSCRKYLQSKIDRLAGNEGIRLALLSRFA